MHDPVSMNFRRQKNLLKIAKYTEVLIKQGCIFNLKCVAGLSEVIAKRGSCSTGLSTVRF